MVDIVSASRRSQIMARIGSKDTGPERVVRKICTLMGRRYRLNRKDLPGSPDLVFKSLSLAIFVHGCFWHRHRDCRLAYTPKSRVEFWAEKFARNEARDAAAARALRRLGWRVAVVWECETRNPQKLQLRLARLLGPT